MVIDASELAPGSTLQADVCVIGGGPAGLTTAHQLAEDGVDVVLLESGSSVPPPGGEPYELARNVGLPYPLEASRSRGLGGSSHLWEELTPYRRPYLRLRELDPLDFESRPGVGFRGWPFAKSELAPHYSSAWDLFGLPRPSADDDRALEAPVEQRTFDFGPAATFTEWLPHTLRRHPHVRIVAGATATEVLANDARDWVSSVQWRSESGAAFAAVARVYVLAAGGIENARLLLASRSARPEGIGNANGLVGRHFMEHPHCSAGLLIPADGALRAESRLWDVVVEDGRARQRKYGVDPDLIRGEGLLNTVFRLIPRPAVLSADGRVHDVRTQALLDVRTAVANRRLPPVPAVARVAAASPAVARFLLERSRGRHSTRSDRSRVQQIFTLSTMTEQAPLRESRVRLGTERDSMGVPIPELDLRTGPLDVMSMRRTLELIGPALASWFGAQVVPVVDPLEQPDMGWGYHHMGTTLMSDDPREGVVDADCRVHGIKNLYVGGSSVFPAGGYANPTITIVALAFRLGAHLATQIGEHPAAGPAGAGAAPS